MVKWFAGCLLGGAALGCFVYSQVNNILFAIIIGVAPILGFIAAKFGNSRSEPLPPKHHSTPTWPGAEDYHHPGCGCD